LRFWFLTISTWVLRQRVYKLLDQVIYASGQTPEVNVCIRLSVASAPREVLLQLEAELKLLQLKRALGKRKIT